MLASADLLIQKNDLRKSALDENTAQNEFETLLEKVSKRKKELNVNKSLVGSLNLAILTQKKYKFKTILFQKGSISSIVNFPEGVEIIHCPDNLVQELSNLPDTLKELNFTNNVLEKIDLSKSKNLLSINVSYNELKTIPSLPESLETLICHHNQLEDLDLKNTIHLKTLHCNDNPKLRLENIPDSVTNGNYPQVLVQNLKKVETLSSKNEKENLEMYFSFKKSYEEELRIMHEMKKKEMPKCLGCNKNVGMVFSNKNRKYQAYCGGNPPCSWKIVIHRGKYVPREDVLYTYYNDVEEMKEKIIQQKMSTLFRYMGESKAAELFEQQMTAYKSANKYLEELLHDQEQLFYSEEKIEQIQKKQLQINEALERVNAALKNNEISEAVRIQHDEIMPLSKSIQHMQYERMTMIQHVEDTSKKGKSLLTYILLQEEVTPEKLEINLGDPAKD